MPSYILEQIPEEFSQSPDEWKKLALKFYQTILLSGTKFEADIRAEIASAIREIVQMVTKQIKFTYIGSDGKDHATYEDMKIADDDYNESINQYN